jgi:type IV secretion system protein VirD4
VAPVAPTPIKFGYYYDPETDTADRNEPQIFGGETHCLLFGVNGAGKSTRILIENLAFQLRGRSLVVFDMKGELLAQTQRARKLLGDDVKVINPYNLHNYGSDGFNPLATLDPADDEFFDKVKEITFAMIESEAGEKNPFFSQSARGWFCAGIMWEVIQARREGRPASLLRAREWCLQPDQWVVSPDGKLKALAEGVTVNAKRMVAEGGRQIANLAATFARDELNRSDRDVLKTLDTETEFLVSNPIARDLEKGDWRFAQLRHTPTTVFIVLPPNQVNDKRRWTRMLMTVALHDPLKPGPVRTLFILDEFRVSIGHLQIVNDFWALVRGYGVQFMPVCQSVLQLKALFKDEWENYAGQAGAVITIGAPGDTATADWMSKRSGMTTIWKEGWSSGEGQGASGMNSNEGTNISQVGIPFRSPQELMNLPRGTGVIWLQGMGDQSIPFFAPEYWNRPDVAWLVDENPYRAAVTGGSSAAAPTAGNPSPSHTPSEAKIPGLVWALGIGCVIAALMLFGGGNSPAPQKPLPPIRPPAHTYR